MTYTFKLSRRLARLKNATVFAASLFTLSCAADGGPSGPGSTTTDPTNVVIAPDSISVGANQTVQFQAATDTSGALSFSLGGKGRGRRKVVSLALSPASSSVILGGSQSFNATATLNDGSTATPSVTWSATGGTIDASGRYTAGPIAGNYAVSAKAANGVADTAAVVVTETTPIIADISLSPTSAALPVGGSKQFTVTGNSTDGATIPVAPKFAATGGTISSTGMYHASQTPGTYRIIATDTLSSVADTSSVTITPLGVTLQSVVLIPTTTSVAQGAKQQFSASGQMSDGSTVPLSPSFTATGGTISSSGEYTAGNTAGTYWVIASDQASGKADTATVTITPSSPVPGSTLEAVVLTPANITLESGAAQQFAASGRMSDGSTTAVGITYSETGGAITNGGRYTAGSVAGSYRVIATQTGGTLADTSLVTITATPVTLQAVVLTPTTVSLAAGGTQQFTASGRMSDGSTSAVTVAWSAAGGTISSAGFYTASQTAGTFRVVATQSGGNLADTAVVTITAPAATPPPPTNGTTYFSADAEAGTMNPWSAGWGIFSNFGNPVPVNSTAQARDGLRAWRYEITNPVEGAASQTLAGNPQTSMGSPNGRFLSGYYSFWAYIDAGYTGNNWNMLLGWMTGVTGAPSPISHVELVVVNGVLQLRYVLKNCAVGLYACPTIPGYATNSGYYQMTSSSPAGIKAFPRNQWVHLSFYYKMSQSNGQVTAWQDGVKIMDLTAPTMNTFGGHSINPLHNTAGDMILQFGIYGGATSGTQRLYVDDFKVTDYRVQP